MRRLIDVNRRSLLRQGALSYRPQGNFGQSRQGQQPYATSSGHSDSRVAPELIFNANFGELFIVRVAWNVVSPDVMGSLHAFHSV